MTLFYVLFLSTAVGMDALASGVAYGIKDIEIPFSSLTVIALVTVICAAVGKGGSHLVGGVVSVHTETAAGALLLVALGGYRLLFDYLTKDTFLHESGHRHLPRKLTLSVGGLIVRIMVKPEAADQDASHHISPGEAVMLGIALAVDNMVAASAASLAGRFPLYAPVAMGGVQAVLLAMGVYGAKWLIDHQVRFRFPYVSGTVLIALGLVRLFL